MIEIAFELVAKVHRETLASFLHSSSSRQTVTNFLILTSLYRKSVCVNENLRSTHKSGWTL